MAETRGEGGERPGQADLPAFARFGVYSEIEQPLVSVVNPGSVAIGVAVHIGAYAVIEALVPDRGITVEFDDRAYVGHFLRLTSIGGVRIGADAMLSDRVYVSDTSHIYEDVTRPIKVQGLRDGRSVDIGDGAWVGIGAAICGNVRIGRNAVVGANAVVVHDVPDCTVVAGNPAVVVRRHDGDAWHWATDPVS
jgi:acetyltransferase-like isoleucine patch superfamily enzyme